MSKGLEELKDLKNAFIGHCRELKCEENYIKVCENKFGKIEKELKALEKYEDFVQEICRYIGLDNLFPYDNLEEIEKEIKTMADNAHWFAVKQDQKKLKALEIIKREPSMVGWQAGYEDYEDYLDNTPEEQRYIKSKEEFDLLKEVLL